MNATSAVLEGNASAALAGALNATAAAVVQDETGFFVAYGALFLMAVVPIYVGSYLSLTSEKQESMTHKDAAMFPLYASAALFSLYLLFTYLGTQYVNLLLGLYFLLLGVGSLWQSLRPLLAHVVPASFMADPYRLRLTRGEGEHTTELFSMELDKLDLVCMAVAAPFGAFYVHTKHWVANNILGISFSINGVAMLSLGRFQIACLLLGGLFFYDIYWVFFTNVMVTVAKSFEAPIKLVFPKDLLEEGLAANKFAMLGLGDIVIPGVVVALMLRFDQTLRPGSSAYFSVTMLGYVLGLLTTIVVMHTFQAAQPALLYLVPCCLLLPLLLSVVKGQTAKLFAYSDEQPAGEEAPAAEGGAGQDEKKTD